MTLPFADHGISNIREPCGLVLTRYSGVGSPTLVHQLMIAVIIVAITINNLISSSVRINNDVIFNGYIYALNIKILREQIKHTILTANTKCPTFFYSKLTCFIDCEKDKA